MKIHSRKIRVIKKYVDDLFLLITKGKVNEILAIFNSIDDRVQFTFDLEKDKCIPFFDMTVMKPIKNMSPISKPVSSGRMLNYHSIYPMSKS